MNDSTRLSTDEIAARAKDLFRGFQQSMCEALEDLEGGAHRFRAEPWLREGGGGGESRVLEGGDFLEKGGVNFSEVHGDLPEDLAPALPGEGKAFWAAGVSVVLHPRNPYVPTTHANFRMIRKGETFWFGGGADLTPFYPFDEDCRLFHRALKRACDAHDHAWHARFKKWCDLHFYLPHRQEARGIGGIFFDLLEPGTDGHCATDLLAFLGDAAAAFRTAWLDIAAQRRDHPWGERERAFQLHRRGRYVEFNLMYDRGTTFGLKTGRRVESILMSLPPHAAWHYDFRPAPDSPEARLAAVLTPRDWAGGE